MAKEIERKFLVDATLIGPLSDGTEIRQGYLSGEGAAVVRVRLAGSRAWLTIKGRNSGPSRSEYEYEIPAVDGQQMIEEFCAGRVIWKTRYRRVHADYLWEIDVFAGDNAGLIIAEVELSTADEQPPLPPWLGLEVTRDRRYYNNNLYTHPFGRWQRCRDDDCAAGSD